MEKIFILNPAATPMDIHNSIYETITKTSAIISCLSSADAGLFSSMREEVLWAVQGYLEELKQLQDGLNLYY